MDFFDWRGGASATLRKFSYVDSDIPDGEDLSTLVRLVTGGRLHPDSPSDRVEGAEMSDTERSRAVVRDYVASLQAGDSDALRASFTPDATWWLRGDLPVSGTWTGPGEILDTFLAAMVDRLDTSKPLTQELRGIVADGDTVVAEWTSRATTRDGQSYENDYAVVFVVRDGKIAAVREYFDTGYAQRVLFGDPTGDQS
jgi:hypothetical protein